MLSTALQPLAADHGEWVGRLGPIIDAEVARLEERLIRTEDAGGEQWSELTDLANRIERLAAEILAFVGGMSARAAGLDEGECDLADRVLAKTAEPLIVAYRPITLPASAEYIDVLSEVIRVRFPGRGLWDLPLVLHEFGHYLLARFRSTTGAHPSTIIERESVVGQRPVPFRSAFAEELWADTFATYVGGPAYALAALSRFDPASAHKDRKPTHPSPMKRAEAIFTTLEHSQGAWRRSDRVVGNLEDMLILARADWEIRLRGAGVGTEPDEETCPYGSRLAGQFIEILDREAVGSRYANAERAAAVRGWLVERLNRPSGYSLIDVMNGAWWARCEMQADNRVSVAEIAAAANELCANM